MRRRDVASSAAKAAILAIACLFAPFEARAQATLALLSGEAAATAEGPTDDFVEQQLRYARVREAQRDADVRMRGLFAARGLPYPGGEVFLRAFKRERVLELWVRHPRTRRFVKLEEYAICALSGDLGPKSRKGDEQVPEGFYYIDTFNPWSQYHLSLGLNYPSRADRLRTGSRQPLGGDIFIHGDCKTVGCLPLTDEKIEELYWLAVQARAAGQGTIPVHIFPGRMDDAGMRLLELASVGQPALRAFWRNLKDGYDYFEQSRELPAFDVDTRGGYVVPRYAGLPIDVLESPALYTF